MPNYKKMYFKLFNDVTDAIELLKKAQIDAEEEYINSSEEEKNILKLKKNINKNNEEV